MQTTKHICSNNTAHRRALACGNSASRWSMITYKRHGRRTKGNITSSVPETRRWAAKESLLKATCLPSSSFRPRPFSFCYLNVMFLLMVVCVLKQRTPSSMILHVRRPAAHGSRVGSGTRASERSKTGYRHIHIYISCIYDVYLYVYIYIYIYTWYIHIYIYIHISLSLYIYIYI